MPGDAWQQGAPTCARCWRTCGRTRASSCCSWAASSGRPREWSEERSLDWDLLDDPLHGGIKTLVGDLNRVYREQPGAVDAGHHARGLLLDRRQRRERQRAELPAPRRRRRRRPTVLACIANFSGGPHDDYRVGLPFAGRWREVLNTDAELYGGSGVGNFGGRRGGAVRVARAARVGRRCSSRPPGCCGWRRSRSRGRSGGPAPRAPRLRPTRPGPAPSPSCPPPSPTTPSPWLRRAGRRRRHRHRRPRHRTRRRPRRRACRSPRPPAPPTPR